MSAIKESPLLVSSEVLILPEPPSCILSTDFGYIVGTYTLHESLNSHDADDEDEAKLDGSRDAIAERTGSLYLLSAGSDDGQMNFRVIDKVPTESAVLDIAGRSEDGHLSFVAVANSTGGIEIWTPSYAYLEDDTKRLQHTKTVRVSGKDTLVLKINAHPSRDRNSIFAASLSNGSIVVVDLESPEPILWREQIHTLEPWEVVWVPFRNDKGSLDSHTLMSGGDDSALHLTRVPTDVFGLSEMPQIDGSVTSDTRAHAAGVTAILPLPQEINAGNLCSGQTGDLVITGSYDDHIRLLRLRPGRRWECLAEANLGGGVWRLLPLPAFIPSTPDTHTKDGYSSCLYILASCMYAGARIIQLTRHEDGSWSFAVLARFEEHESMNYASTFAGQADERGLPHLEDLKMITTSFYDKRFCVWSVPKTS